MKYPTILYSNLFIFFYCSGKEANPEYILCHIINPEQLRCGITKKIYVIVTPVLIAFFIFSWLKDSNRHSVENLPSILLIQMLFIRKQIEERML